MAKSRRRSIPIPMPQFVEGVLDSSLDRAMRVQRPGVVSYVNRARAKRGLTPEDTIRELERIYLGTVTAIGAMAGASAAFPGWARELLSPPLPSRSVLSLKPLRCSAVAVAEVHGLRVDNLEQRRALVLALLLGDEECGSSRNPLAGRDARARSGLRFFRSTRRRRPSAGRTVALPSISCRRFGLQQGALLLGRAIPMGIGAGIGAAGNAALARASIAAARRVFGPPPERFPPPIVEVPPPDPSPWESHALVRVPERLVEGRDDGAVRTSVRSGHPFLGSTAATGLTRRLMPTRTS